MLNMVFSDISSVPSHVPEPEPSAWALHLTSYCGVEYQHYGAFLFQ